MATGADGGPTLPQLIAYAFTLLFVVRVLGHLKALFFNSNIVMVLQAVPCAYLVTRLSLWGPPEGTHVLLVALGIVTLHGCGATVAALQRLRLAFEGKLVVDVPPRAAPAARPQAPQRPAPGGRGGPQRRTR